MKNPNVSRRTFLKRQSLSGLGLMLSPSLLANLPAGTPIAETPTSPTVYAPTQPALLGGKPAWSPAKWPKWPQWNPDTDEKQVLDVIRSGVWSRANVVNEFETEWAKALGVKRSLTVVNGTNALVTALSQLDVQVGDEVLVTPYTYISTVSAILSNNALPVFVDVDPKTFQMDPDLLEAKITPRTKAIMAVHILGLPADMDRIMAIANKHKLAVVEDACQAHFAEYKHQRVGGIGHAGCFSFQNSKNLPIGEGGAIVSNDDAFMDRCFSHHFLGFPYGTMVGSVAGGSVRYGTKYRYSEYQAAIGLAQLKRLDAQTTTRNENANYLKSKIKDLPGIVPYEVYPNVTRGAFHLFPFQYKADAFKGLSRAHFLKALSAEGVPCSSGYSVLNTQPFLNQTFQSKVYKLGFPKELLNLNAYNERNRCPKNDQMCEEAVWFTQNMLLGSRADMDAIASAIEKVHQNAEKIKKLSLK